MYLEPQDLKIFSTVYDFNNFLSDLGGILGIILKTFFIMFYPIAKFFYYINASKRLFLARTIEHDLFKKPCLSTLKSKFEKRVYDLA